MNPDPEIVEAAAVVIPKGYLWLKWLHVLGLVVYAGGFLALTRLLGHAVRFEAAQSRADAYRIYTRMHKFVDWGGLAIMVIAGLWLLVWDPLGKDYLKQGYFHMKLTFVVLLVVCDALLTRRLFGLRGDVAVSSVFFRVMHAVAALMVVGALIAVFVIRG